MVVMGDFGSLSDQNGVGRESTWDGGSNAGKGGSKGPAGAGLAMYPLRDPLGDGARISSSMALVGRGGHAAGARGSSMGYFGCNPVAEFSLHGVAAGWRPSAVSRRYRSASLSSIGSFSYAPIAAYAGVCDGLGCGVEPVSRGCR